MHLTKLCGTLLMNLQPCPALLLHCQPIKGSPFPSPTNQGASASNGAGAVASGSDGSVVPAELFKRRIEQRTKERDEAMAKAEALEKRIKELEAEGKVIHLLFSN